MYRVTFTTAQAIPTTSSVLGTRYTRAVFGNSIDELCRKIQKRGYEIVSAYDAVGERLSDEVIKRLRDATKLYPPDHQGDGEAHAQ
jgi:hypothetical protein